MGDLSLCIAHRQDHQQENRDLCPTPQFSLHAIVMCTTMYRKYSLFFPVYILFIRQIPSDPYPLRSLAYIVWTSFVEDNIITLGSLKTPFMQ